MNKKRGAIILGVIVSAVAALAIGLHAQGGSPPPSNNVIPDYEIYSFVFHEVVAYNKKAAELQAQGKDGSFLSSFYQKRANLSDAEASALTQIALECVAKVAEQDAQAQALVTAFRATPKVAGITPQSSAAGPSFSITSQLSNMQLARNNLILSEREKLHAAFGDAEFARFDQFVHINSKVGVQTKPANRPNGIQYLGPQVQLPRSPGPPPPP